MIQNLTSLHKLQNKLFLDDCFDDFREQRFLYFLGNHPTLFQEFINQEQMTIAEMNYIVEHFSDYNVDPRTFELEFKRVLHEKLPRYNILKGIELADEVFELTESSYIREIVSARANHVAQNTTGTNSTNTIGNNGTKTANKTLPMQSSGTTFDGIINWTNGASNIQEQKDSISNSISSQDAAALIADGTDNGNSKETYARHDNAVDHVEKIWSYVIKPKAIDWLTSELSCAFVLVY